MKREVRFIAHFAGGVCAQAVVASLVLLGSLVLPSTELLAAWTAEDDAFADYLIGDLEYLDTATRWLDEKAGEAGVDKRAAAEIESRRLDIYQSKGDHVAFSKLLDEFKRRFPEHRRSRSGGLEQAGQLLSDVLTELENAVLASADVAEKKRQAARQAFYGEVVPALEQLIEDFGQQLKSGKEAARDTLIQTIDQTELARVNFFLLFARPWPSASPERQKALERGLELAEAFVDKGTPYFGMEYSCQLQRGVISYELGRYLDAEGHLEVLYGIEPPIPKPHPDALVAAFKDLRLQALLFGTRSLNSGAQYREARRVLDRYFFGETSKGGAAPSYADLRETVASWSSGKGVSVQAASDLKKFAVLTCLEYGIAIIGSGQVEDGLNLIQGVIGEYSDSDGAQGKAFVVDAQKALGRIALINGVDLRGQDYYQAALGLKSDHRYTEALTAFQTALAALGSSDPKEMGALCLNEIGEMLFLLDRYAESAVAYAELFDAFDFVVESTPIAARAAQNFLAAVNKTIDTTADGSDHTELQRLFEDATRRSEQHSGKGLSPLQAQMSAAGRLAGEGRFEEAREIYLAIPKKLEQRDGGSSDVPFYWRAQAQAEEMVFDAQRSAELDGDDPSAMDALIPRLEKIARLALKDGQLDGAARASLVLAQIFSSREDWAAVERSLTIFESELAHSASLDVCSGMGLLVIAEARQGRCAQARKGFAKLVKNQTCRALPVVGVAALDLADCFDTAGAPFEAARYTLIYSVRDDSQEDFRDLDVILMVASRLAEGSLYASGKSQKRFRQEASKRLKLAAKHQLSRQPEYKRQQTLIRAKLLRARKKYSEAAKVLRRYVKEFNAAAGANEEDPYVFRDLAEIYWNRRSVPSVKDANRADAAYTRAVVQMGRRRVSVAAEYRESLGRTYWDWVKRLMEIKLFRLDAGEATAYGEIVQFLKPQTAGEMGGKKEEFLELLRQTEEKRPRS